MNVWTIHSVQVGDVVGVSAGEQSRCLPITKMNSRQITLEDGTVYSRKTGKAPESADNPNAFLCEPKLAESLRETWREQEARKLRMTELFVEFETILEDKQDNGEYRRDLTPEECRHLTRLLEKCTEGPLPITVRVERIEVPGSLPPGTPSVSPRPFATPSLTVKVLPRGSGPSWQQRITG